MEASLTFAPLPERVRQPHTHYVGATGDKGVRIIQFDGDESGTKLYIGLMQTPIKESGREMREAYRTKFDGGSSGIITVEAKDDGSLSVTTSDRKEGKTVQEPFTVEFFYFHRSAFDEAHNTGVKYRVARIRVFDTNIIVCRDLVANFVLEFAVDGWVRHVGLGGFIDEGPRPFLGKGDPTADLIREHDDQRNRALGKLRKEKESTETVKTVDEAAAEASVCTGFTQGSKPAVEPEKRPVLMD